MKPLWMSNRRERMERLEERNHLVERQSSARNWDREMEMADYFVVDIETSGFDSTNDVVLSVASATMSGPGLALSLDQYDLVRQDRVEQIPEHIWALTGLTSEELREGREWHEVLLRTLSLSANRVWVAHHARHELSFMQRHARLLWKMKLHPLVIDTAVVAQVLFRLPDVPTLEAVCERLEVTVHNRHRADGDVLMTAEVWRREIQHCRRLGLSTIGDVIEWSISHAG